MKQEAALRENPKLLKQALKIQSTLFMGPLLPSRSRIVVVLGQLYEQHSRTRVILYTKLLWRIGTNNMTGLSRTLN